MAHVQDRWYRSKRDSATGEIVLNSRGKPAMEKTELFGIGLRYKVRYIDPDGHERSKSFPDRKKKRAEDFLVEVESDKREGRYINPQAGKRPFSRVAKEWMSKQTFDYTTRERVQSRIDNHLIPYFKDRPIGGIKPSDVQAWLRWLQDRHVSENSRVLYFTHLVSIFNYAKADKMILVNPAQSKAVTRPREETSRAEPWPTERANAVHAKLPARYRPAVKLPVGLGLRQGEVFGFSLDDADRDRNIVLIQRQVRVVGYTMVFAPPKRGKTREIPIGARLLDELDDYAKQFPAVPVTLPWIHEDGKLVTVNLLMTNADNTALRRQTFRLRVWLPALQAAGVTPEPYQDGMHALRHLYASVLLDAGESIKALSRYLGHKDPGFTLKVYTHLMPTSHERTRNAVDAFLENSFRDPGDPGDALAA